MADFAQAPINYAAMQNTPDPFEAFANGYKAGDLIHQRQSEDSKAKKEADEKAKMETSLKAAHDNPSRENITALLQYPGMKEFAIESLAHLSDTQKQAYLSTGSKIAYAAKQGRNDLAAQLAQEAADAATNSKDATGAKDWQYFADRFKDNPQDGAFLSNLIIAGNDPEKYQQTMAGLGAEGRSQDLHPALVDQGILDANKKKVDAELEGKMQSADLANKQADIAAKVALLPKTQAESDYAVQKQQADIAKTKAETDKKIAESTHQLDESFIDLGMPKPDRVPWRDIQDTKKRDMLKSRVYSDADKKLGEEKNFLASQSESAQDVSRFMELNKNVDTGGLTDKYAAGQFMKGFGRDYSEMLSISAKLAPRQRVTGSGSTSDYEGKQFLKAVPGVDRLYETNLSIANALKSRAENSGDYIAFKQKYLEQNGTLQGADGHWKKYQEKNPILDPNTPNTYTLNPNRQSWESFFSGAPAKQAPANQAPANQAPANDALKSKALSGAKAAGLNEEVTAAFLKSKGF